AVLLGVALLRLRCSLPRAPVSLRSQLHTGYFSMGSCTKAVAPPSRQLDLFGVISATLPSQVSILNWCFNWIKSDAVLGHSSCIKDAWTTRGGNMSKTKLGWTMTACTMVALTGCSNDTSGPRSTVALCTQGENSNCREGESCANVGETFACTMGS